VSQSRDSSISEPAGILYAGAAYSAWGITPLYWHFLAGVPPLELTTHRVLWCAIFVAGITLWRGRMGYLRALLADRALLRTLALTSVLISINWSVFIYCVATHQLVEATLGYFLSPLLSVAMGVFLFGERMSRLRLAGVSLAAAALVLQMIALGHVPWIGPALALSFGFYGYFHKKVPVDSLDGILVETGIMFPFALALVVYWGLHETRAFPAAGATNDVLLIGGGPMTAIPLVLFAAGVQRITMTTLGFLQYLTPTLTLLLAVLGFHEAFTRLDAISFACLWAALAIVAMEGRFKSLAPEAG
jgi:chloramphenicol-sensitive protein RarD